MDAPFGVLALQGDFAAHAAAFRHLGVPVREVRRVAELEGLGGLMIPRGESTTLLNLMRDEPSFEAVRSLHASGAVVAGTCAGAILLSREVRPRVITAPAPPGEPVRDHRATARRTMLTRVSIAPHLPSDRTTR